MSLVWVLVFYLSNWLGWLIEIESMGGMLDLEGYC